MRLQETQKECCDIAVIVVFFKSEDYILRCIGSAAEFGVQCHLVLNSPLAPELYDELFRAHPHLTILDTHQNLGFVGGNNAALGHIKDPTISIIGLLNPDAWLQKGWANAIRSQFASNPRHGILAPVQLTYEEGGELADWTKKVVGVDTLDQVQKKGALISVPWVEGSGLFIRRGIWGEEAILDPIYNMYFEEVDLCRRIRRMGWEIAIITNSLYHHAVGTSLGGQNTSARQVRKDLGQLIYIATNPNQSMARNFLGVAAKYAISFRYWLLGHYSGFPKFAARGAIVLMSNGVAILRKWNRDRRLKPCRT